MWSGIWGALLYSRIRPVTENTRGGGGHGTRQLFAAPLRPCAAPQARPRGSREGAGLCGALRAAAPSAPADTEDDTGPTRPLRAPPFSWRPGAEPAGPRPTLPRQRADPPQVPDPHLPPRPGPVPPPPGRQQEVPPLRPPGVGGSPTGRRRPGCYYGSQTRRGGVGKRAVFRLLRRSAAGR